MKRHITCADRETEADRPNKWIRIAELERLSGVPRRTIHFYLQEGLLHPPMKTGRTMAYYDDDHVRKLRRIREAKRQGLPLMAIHGEIADMDKDGGCASVQSFSDEETDIPERSRPGRRPRKEKGRKTREKILELGCVLFRRKGYRRTRISDITSALDVGKGTFYFYFNDKKELLLECVPRIFTELFASGWEQIRKIQDPLKRLELRAQLVMPVLREFCAVLQLCKEALEEADPNIRKLGEQTYLSIRRPIEADIEKGIQLGLFNPMDPRIAGTAMIGIMESLYYMRTIDNQLPSSSMTGNVFGLLLDGIRKR